MTFHVKKPIIQIGDDENPLIQISKVDGEVWLAPSLRNESEAAKLFWAALHEAAFDKKLEAEIGAAKAIKRAKADRSDDRLMEMPWQKIQKTPGGESGE